MRIFVAGGCGFIGSHYVRMLLERDHDVTVFDALTYRGLPENIDGLDVRFIQGDICDEDALDRAIPGHDAVVNFANFSFVDRSIRWPEEFVRTNVTGTATLVEAVRRLDVPKFLHVSTDEVYGSIESGAFTEHHPLEPSSPYSATKAAGDLYVRASHLTYGTPALITRSCNIFGPRQFPENVLPLFITNLIDGKSVPLYGDGLNVREWLYVPDVCDAIQTVLERGADGEIYNIGSGVERTNIDLTRDVLGILGLREDLIEYVEDRPGHDRRYALDWSKIRALGWKPTHEFSGALAETVDWYRENRSWWEPLRARMGT
ncbi:MAG TPA: dTDP-glucose 4,6-dehydratase [Actinomycetota bacterium]|nr:dTDP-glucose 4,6-dehydratase [Actinomycetota bacterium]